MVQIQHRPLRTLKKQLLASSQRFIHQVYGFAHIGRNLFTINRKISNQAFLNFALNQRQARPAEYFVLFTQIVIQFFQKRLPGQQIHQSNSLPGNLIHISRADTAPGGTDFFITLQVLLIIIHSKMIGHNDESFL